MNHKNDNLCFTDLEKAHVFNNYFQEVFTEDDGFLPPITSKLTSLMPNFEIESSDILQAVKNINDKCSRTPENVPAFLVGKFNFIVIS